MLSNFIGPNCISLNKKYWNAFFFCSANFRMTIFFIFCCTCIEDQNELCLIYVRWCAVSEYSSENHWFMCQKPMILIKFVKNKFTIRFPIPKSAIICEKVILTFFHPFDHCALFAQLWVLKRSIKWYLMKNLTFLKGPMRKFC